MNYLTRQFKINFFIAKDKKTINKRSLREEKVQTQLVYTGSATPCVNVQSPSNPLEISTIL